ncbi:MAG: bifunctional phosphopantothenoylcysteine decarboxylase/phosphopantothenate--cysteine ligase CoaBC [Aquabacterium sp.]|nr:bifunctional phosphopantothenoylcysteine decarboxylase/phosphopantothenate--cysteine ligase CoaBC [Aquabacterium sp.]
MSERTDLQGRHILLGLTGGIACYKSAELVRLLTKAGATVQVVMTEAAATFITPVTMQALSGRPVLMSQWDAREPNNMAHINFGREADAILIAPASADFMSKLAQGRADELLSLTCLARPRETVPLLVAPAMNREMWAHPATQRNVALLEQDGTTILGPGAGDQACGEVGDGRMLEPDQLLEDLIAALAPKVLQWKRILITAGPTFEPIDPVRGITNHSSGKMGFALARAAREAGAIVQLVAGPVHLPTPRGVQRTNVMTAQQMYDAVLPMAAQSDVFIATAAVADWRPATLAEHKIKKEGKKVAPTFELTENPDILAAVAQKANAAGGMPYCVGFAAESEQLLTHARAKLQRKQIPLIIGNLGPATLGKDDNALLVVDAQSHHALPSDGVAVDKLTLARALMLELAKRLATQPHSIQS